MILTSLELNRVEDCKGGNKNKQNLSNAQQQRVSELPVSERRAPISAAPVLSTFPGTSVPFVHAGHTANASACLSQYNVPLTTANSHTAPRYVHHTCVHQSTVPVASCIRPNFGISASAMHTERSPLTYVSQAAAGSRSSVAHCNG